MRTLRDKMLGPKSQFLSVGIKVTGVVLIALLVIPWLFEYSEALHRFIGVYVPSRSWKPTNYHSHGKPTPPEMETFFPTTERPSSKLIRDIREAVKRASGGSPVTFSAEDRKAWDEKFPCRSRSELESYYSRRKYVRYVPLNSRWLEVLDEYSVLHRTCMSKVGDLKNYFLAKNDTAGCKFVVAESHFGLGNKVLHMISMVMYAVLTQRVILVPSYTSVPPIMCEPFPGSQWSMWDDMHHTTLMHRRNNDELYKAIDDEITNNHSMDIYASMGGGIWGPDSRFWCNTEQNMLSKVTWLTFDGCLHHLPKLFAIEKFRPILEDIFPKRIVSTNVLRTVMLPADPVWARIVHAMKVHLDGAEKQVGVQVRFLHGDVPVNEHINRCLLEDGSLPELCPDSTAPNDADSKFVNCSSALPDTNPPPVTKVLIASLVLGFHDYLKEKYLRSETVHGEVVGIVQLTHEKTQGSGVEVDSQALVEIITLSFSDVLLVTPFSTFGGLAQAYGTLIPYFIEFNATEKVPCQRGLTTEPCYLGSMPMYECRYDISGGSNVVETVPYLQRCMHIDVGPGYSMLMMNGD